jgi:hypothetical protein
MSTSRFLVKNVMGVARKLPHYQPKTQLSSIAVDVGNSSDVHQFQQQEGNSIMYISYAAAESDFVAGAILGEIPSNSTLKKEAEDAILSTYTFASPESDFCSTSLPQIDQMDKYKIGKGLSFVSAESDFSAGFSMPEVIESEMEKEAKESINRTYSFASAESDFTSAAMPEKELQLQFLTGMLSFSSPESDFCMGATAPAASSSLNELKQEAYISINETYSFSSAESDFATAKPPSIFKDEVLVPPSLSFASPESDWSGSVAAAYGALDMGLGVSRKHSPVYQDTPKKVSYKEAIFAASSSAEPRVITEGVAPFRIVHANEAWEKVYENNKGILGHTLAVANLMALGKDEVQSIPTKIGVAQLKVQPIEGNLMLNVLEGHKQEAMNTSSTTIIPDQKKK